VTSAVVEGSLVVILVVLVVGNVEPAVDGSVVAAALALPSVVAESVSAMVIAASSEQLAADSRTESPSGSSRRPDTNILRPIIGQATGGPKAGQAAQSIACFVRHAGSGRANLVSQARRGVDAR
jgi:hypothetical protein